MLFLRYCYFKIKSKYPSNLCTQYNPERGIGCLRFEVAIEHELHDHVDGLVPRADAEQLDDVPVVEPLHHLGLAEEVNLLVDGAARFQGLHRHGHLE